MPCAGVERPVKVRDEAVLGEVQLDLAEELREREAVQLYCGDAPGVVVDCFGLRDRLLAGSRSEAVVLAAVGGVGACNWIRCSNAVLGAVCVSEIPKLMVRSRSAFFAPAMPSPPLR